MGYYMAINTQALPDTETLDSQTEQQYLEQLELTDAEKEELTAD